MGVQPAITMVVIGFNESRNLHQTFTAIKNMNYPTHLVELIYIDSGSTDESVEIAKKYCEKICIEPLWPSAARNRNRGLIESKHSICHFLDGDIIIDPDYIWSAVSKLQEGDVQAVFGYLEEKNKKGLNKILLHDYSNRKPGYINAPGAGGTFIKKPLLEISAWDERIPRGEETEFGERFLQAGYKIWYLDKKMGIHDYGIAGLLGFLKKQIKEGMSAGQVLIIDGEGPFFSKTRQTIKNNFIIHLLVILLIFTSIIFKYYYFIPLFLLVYPLYLFFKYKIQKKITNPETLKYFFLTNLTRTWVLFGYVKFIYLYLALPKKEKESLKTRFSFNDK
jgi:glycosyltransferase involved in cell wall biosynthesis